MTVKRLSPRTLPALLACLFSGAASASGFQLLEQNASGLGNAYAGSAAVAEDASTIFFNPAGLTALPQGKNLVLAGNAIKPSAKFSDSGISRTGGGRTMVGLVATQTDFGSSGSGGDAGSLAFVPAAYFAMSLDAKWTVGLGINAPFGMKTEYEDGWMGRFQGIKSDMKTLNINPTVAYKASDMVSLGFGLDYQKIEATLTKAVNLTAIISNASPALAAAVGNKEGRQELTGSDAAWGFNLGATFNLSERTRLGLAYRSPIKYQLTGTQTVTRQPTGNIAAEGGLNAYANIQNQAVSLDIKLPDTFTTSVVQKLDDKWEMLGDLSWTGWSKIQEIRVNFTAPGSTPDVTNWKLKDTWRVAFGGTYRYTDAMKFRFGLAYDQSPVPDAYRTVRLPDSDRTWLSLGMQYKPTKQSALDLGFTYIWVKSPTINNNGEIPLDPNVGYARGLTNGSYDNNVVILGGQYTRNF